MLPMSIHRYVQSRKCVRQDSRYTKTTISTKSKRVVNKHKDKVIER